MFLAFIPTLINIALNRAELRISHGPVRLIWKALSRPSAKRKPLALYGVHASCPLNPESRILSCMAAADPCSELRELKQQYESALRVWAQYEFPLHNEPVGTRAQRSEHLLLKQRALEERNAANDHVLNHKRICPFCIGKAG
jgi:hypothetical protein